MAGVVVVVAVVVLVVLVLLTLALVASAVVAVVLDLGFMMLLTSQVISTAFYSERRESDKFCSAALILA